MKSLWVVCIICTLIVTVYLYGVEGVTLLQAAEESSSISQGCISVGSPSDTTWEADTAKLPERIDLDGVTVYTKEKRVEIEGCIVLLEGILEYIAVTEEGKTYESVLALKCKPSNLHAALLVIGAVPGDVPNEAKGDYTDTDETEVKLDLRSLLNITVQWTVDDKTATMPIERLLYDRSGTAPKEQQPWVFTGSHFGEDYEGKEIYLADVEGSIIAVWYDPLAVINFPVESKNPYRGEDYGFEVNTDILPEDGADVTVTIKSYKDDEEDGKEEGESTEATE